MDYTNFRSAIGGFRRSDVFSYIERTSQEHRQALRELEKQNAALKAENDALKAKIAALEAAKPAQSAEAPATGLNPEAMELAAYRRAEAAERKTLRRVIKLSEQVDVLTAETVVSLHNLNGEAESITNAISQQVVAMKTLAEDAQALLTSMQAKVSELTNDDDE